MQARELFSIEGQSAIVTGAANGLGLAMSEVLLENGACVTMVDIDPAVRDAARRLDFVGKRARAVVADVCNQAQLRAAIGEAHDALGRLDIVCANAGKGSGSGPLNAAGELANVSTESWSGIIDLNLTSVFHTLQAAVPLMRRRKYGRVIVTSSVAGLRGEAVVGYAYSATKAAVANMVRHAAIELSRDNILINAIAPGPFKTNIGNGRMHEEATERVFASRVPLGRIAEPEEIKGITLLLASPASSFITGTVIPIDGGGYACG